MDQPTTPRDLRAKIGLNRGRRRIWLDGERLRKAGFVGGSHYRCIVRPGLIRCYLLSEEEAAERDTFVPAPPDTVSRIRKVTGRPTGKPIIDITGSDVTRAFPEGEAVDVRFRPGGIDILPAQD